MIFHIFQMHLVRQCEEIDDDDGLALLFYLQCKLEKQIIE